tara:strand:+ start:373 stop:1578 length:1206 start_codon:yes stop_codon:yes gene_type:complete
MAQVFDLGNVLSTAENIQGARLENQQRQQTFDTNVLAQKAGVQFNALLQQHFANPTEQSFNAIAAVNPEVASKIQGLETTSLAQTSAQQGIDTTNAKIAVKGATNLINSADPKRFAEIALPELVNQMRLNPNIDVDSFTNEDWLKVGNEIIMKQSVIATAGDDPVGPLSIEGKLQSDINLGFITKEQLKGGKDITFSSVTQNPDGSTTGISSKTGVLEIIPTNTGDVQNVQQVDAINKLITEAKKDKRIDNFITVSSNFDRVDSASSNAAGDLALVFSFMKMLDPGSVVREGEQALARNAAGVPERVRTTYNNILEGVSLSSTQRQSFKAEAGKVFLASRKTAENAVAPIKAQADRLNLRGETIDEMVFGLPDDNAQAVASLVDNGDGTFTMPDGTILVKE